MIRPGQLARQALIWVSRTCLWIVAAILVFGLFQFAYFATGNESFLGCRSTSDVLFYFVCTGPVANFLFNLPLLFAYALFSTALGLPPAAKLVVLFCVLDLIVVFALLRFVYLLGVKLKRLWAAKQE